MRAIAVLILLTGAARADRVLESTSRWNSSGTYIYTEQLVERDDGTVETVFLPGGKVGDVRLTVKHAAALPYVRETTDMASTPMRWLESCVYLTPDSRGVSDIAGDAELAEIVATAASFVQQTESCSYMAFIVDEPTETQSKYDKINAVLFREDRWCRPPVDDEPELCYPELSIAVTNIYHIDSPSREDDGRILDTDVEFNAVRFAMSICDDAGNCPTELGHVVGIDHTCWDMPGDAPLDGEGNPAPLCNSALAPEVLDATMYNYQDAREIKKRTLEADDIAGVCAIYPAAGATPECRRVGTGDGGCTCAAAPGRASGRGAIALLLCQLAMFFGLYIFRR
jgi:hypothetical protein